MKLGFDFTLPSQSFKNPSRPFLSDCVPNPEVDTVDFSKSSKVMIEIGCGTAEHTVNFAYRFPDTTVIGIEHTANRFRKSSERLEANGAPQNVYLIHANAISWITHHVPANKVDSYYLLYPNPYPKRAQRNKRWYAMPFFSKIVETLKTNGQIVLATNIKEYAEEAKVFIATYWQLSLTSWSTLTIPPKEARTLFEKKYLESGQTCFNLTFTKNEI